MLLLLLACDPDYKITTGDSGTFADGTADSGPSQEELDAIWDGARLVIDSPQSGAFLPLGTSSQFKATVYDKDGNATDFDDVGWSSDVDTAWSLLGHDVTDSTLSVGRHAITAEADLPNGDRLAYTVGGVLVQSPYAGIYTGTMSMNVAYDTYQVGCSGAANFTVEPSTTSPRSAFSRPMIMRNKVDLPAPLGPMMPTIAPAGILKLRLSISNRSP